MNAISSWNRGLPVHRLPQSQERVQSVPERRNPDVEGRGALDRWLLSRDFQQRLEEAVKGTSPRAQQVKQVESTYQSFWKDSQDFSMSKGVSLTVPEPPRFVSPAETAWKGKALTVPEFQASGVPQVTQAQEATRAVSGAASPMQPFKLLGHAELRG